MLWGLVERPVNPQVTDIGVQLGRSVACRPSECGPTRCGGVGWSPSRSESTVRVHRATRSATRLRTAHLVTNARVVRNIETRRSSETWGDHLRISGRKSQRGPPVYLALYSPEGLVIFGHPHNVDYLEG